MYVKPNDKLLLFGTAHSGALILQNCEDLGIETTAVYNKEKPFYFANEGDYDGIKEDAEHIALDSCGNVRVAINHALAIWRTKTDKTTIGNGCYIMSKCYIPHDAVIEDEAKLA